MPLGHTHDKMLAQAEQNIQAKVLPQYQQILAQVVNAGLSIMYSQQNAQQRSKHIQESKDPVMEAANGAARLCVVINDQSKKGGRPPTPHPEHIYPNAAMIFAFEYLDLLAQAGKAQITPDLISKTTAATADAILPVLGIKKDILNNMINASQKSQGKPTIPDQAPPATSGGILANAQQGA